MAKFQPKVADEGRDDGLREKMIQVNYSVIHVVHLHSVKNKCVRC